MDFWLRFGYKEDTTLLSKSAMWVYFRLFGFYLNGSLIHNYKFFTMLFLLTECSTSVSPQHRPVGNQQGGDLDELYAVSVFVRTDYS